MSACPCVGTISFCTAQTCVTKFDIVVHCHEPVCHATKNKGEGGEGGGVGVVGLTSVSKSQLGFI